MEVSRHFIFIFSRLKLVAMAVCNMHSLQLISQPFWDCNDCTDQPGVTGCILSCNLSRNVNVEKEIHCKLQKTCYTLQARRLELAMVPKKSMQSLCSRPCYLFKPSYTWSKLSYLSNGNQTKLPLAEPCCLHATAPFSHRCRLQKVTSSAKTFIWS